MDNDDRKELLRAEPDAAPFVRQLLGSVEFLNGIKRWCLWMDGIDPTSLRALPRVRERVAKVREARLASKRAATRSLAAIPSRFGEVRQPLHTYIGIPKTSSERRPLIPIGWIPSSVIAGSELFTISPADLFTFGIVSSTMHMAWVRAVCGRLESRYRYSAGIVYNNFPWPDLADDATGNKTRSAIETAAQGVQDARAQFPDATLADLYDPLSMPPALVKAHQQLDKAVDAAYIAAEKSAGRKVPKLTTDAERVAFLFERYQALTSLLPVATANKPRRSRQARRNGRASA